MNWLPYHQENEDFRKADHWFLGAESANQKTGFEEIGRKQRPQPHISYNQTSGESGAALL